MRGKKENSLRETVLQLAQESLRVKERFFQENADAIVEIVHLIGETFRRGNKILIFGNGGSAADAQHIAAEFVNRFLFDRAPLPAIALTTDSSVLTSIGNDADFACIFSRQIEALGNQGDIAWGITTSGKSLNVIKGLRRAKEKGMATIAFTGKDGGDALRLADHGLNCASTSTPRIQEAHITAGHIICELVERKLFPSGGGR
jgi:D-sedoheptulose 7-phosphate isomerase